MAVDGAAFLREAGHVDHAAALALEMRGHAEHRADRDDAGAADAGDRMSIGLLADRRQHGLAAGGEAPRSPTASRLAFAARRPPR